METSLQKIADYGPVEWRHYVTAIELAVIWTVLCVPFALLVLRDVTNVVLDVLERFVSFCTYVRIELCDLLTCRVLVFDIYNLALRHGACRSGHPRRERL